MVVGGISAPARGAGWRTTSKRASKHACRVYYPLSAGSRELSVDSAEVVGALWEGHVVARLRVFRHGLC